MKIHSSGMLSRDAAYCIYTIGDISLKEINNLIKKLEVDRQILLEYSQLDLMPDYAWYCPQYLMEKYK